MHNFKIEAIFGGVLALLVLGIAVYAVINTSFGAAGGSAKGPVGGGGFASAPGAGGASAPSLTSVSGQDLICECYDDAFQLAGRVNVLSPAYRTGFEQCRARAGVDGGEAWTAGWNARLSARPYETSCRSYKRRKAA